MPTAIVTGATGMLGRAIVFQLGANPEKWTKVHALSRSKKESYPSNVEHDRIDLTSSASELAKQLSNVKADYLFFAAYLQEDDEQKMCDTNGAMLKNFLDALKLTGADKSLKRIILVTGAKQYGVHLGPVRCPMEESDPWLTGPGRPPNFYYLQQDILKEAAGQASWDWTVTYPNDVVGYAVGNFMNIAFTLGLYASINRELGTELEWPGSETFYTRFDDFTTATLHAKFCEWAASSETASNQAFNVVDGQAESWQSMWPKVAKRFGLKVPADQFSKPAPDASTAEPSDNPPISDVAEESGLKGKVAKGKVEQRIDLEKWSQKQEVKDAWNKVAEREGLEKEGLQKGTWGFLSFVLGRNYDLVISSNKARKAGFKEYADTFESLENAWDQYQKAGMLPKLK